MRAVLRAAAERAKRALAKRGPGSTTYLNVDLDVYARAPLDGIVRALGDEAFVLYVGGSRRKYEAHIELAASHMGLPADDTILGLIRLIRRLEPIHRKIWDAAQRREFNIGIQSGLEPHAFELRVQQRTVKAIADVRGVLVVTVYAPDRQHSGRLMTRRRTKAGTSDD